MKLIIPFFLMVFAFSTHIFSESESKGGLSLSYSYPRDYYNWSFLLRYNKFGAFYYDIDLLTFPIFKDPYNGNKINSSIRTIPGFIYFMGMFSSFGPNDLQGLPLDFINVLSSGGFGYKLNGILSVSIHNYFDPVVFRQVKYLKESHDLGLEFRIKSHYFRPSAYIEINYYRGPKTLYGFTIDYNLLSPTFY